MKKLMTRLLVAASLAIAAIPAVTLAAHANQTPISLKDRGKDVATRTLSELEALSPAVDVKVYQPHEEKEIEFKAMPLAPLLDKVYGDKWRKAELVMFVCADGYRNPVEVSRITAHAAWLAVARNDGDFELTEKHPQQKQVELGPLFLIWDTLHDADSKARGLEGWPYQVVGLDLIDFADRYPGLVPSKKASASAKRGFEVFKKYCVTCHALGGEGGSVGPELGKPVSVTTYYKEPWLKRWIRNPSDLRARTAMPAVIPAGADQAKRIDDVVAYLKDRAKDRAPGK
jgi:cytochrome c2